MKYIDIILKYINGYKVSNILFIASELGVFDLLNNKTTAEDIANRLSLNTGAVQIILNVLSSSEIIIKDENFYYLSEEAKKYLVQILRSP